MPNILSCMKWQESDELEQYLPTISLGNQVSGIESLTIQIPKRPNSDDNYTTIRILRSKLYRNFQIQILKNQKSKMTKMTIIIFFKLASRQGCIFYYFFSHSYLYDSKVFDSKANEPVFVISIFPDLSLRKVCFRKNRLAGPSEKRSR